MLNDITQLKQAEQAIQERDKVFQLLADSNPLMIWMTDSAGSLRFVNRAFCEFFVIHPDVVAAGKWQQPVHPDDVRAFFSALNRSVRERTGFNSVARIRNNDGTWHWLASYAEPCFSSEGEYLGLVGNNPDITEQKQVEQELERRVQARTQDLQTINEALKTEVAERIRAEEIIHKVSDRAANLSELSRRLAAARLDLPSVLEIITRSASESFGDYCLIHLLSEPERRLFPACTPFGAASDPVYDPN